MSKILIAEIGYALDYAQKVAEYIWDSGDRYGIWDMLTTVIDRCGQGIATNEEWQVIMDLYHESHTHNGHR